jgi:hypothetical protein
MARQNFVPNEGVDQSIDRIVRTHVFVDNAFFEVSKSSPAEGRYCWTSGGEQVIKEAKELTGGDMSKVKFLYAYDHNGTHLASSGYENLDAVGVWVRR